MFTKSLAALSLVAAAAGAQAASFTFPINDPVGFGRSDITERSFTDTYTFTGLTEGRYVVEAALISADGVKFQSVTVNGVAFEVSGASGTARSGSVAQGKGGGPSFAHLCKTLVVGGQLEMVVVALGDGSASYGGQISATLVPEPGTYALMLGGLAAVGWVARRRRA